MGDKVQTLAYGSWPSPIDAALAAAHDGHPEFVGFVGDEAWWTEPRPTEGGRRTLVRRTADGTEESVLPAPWNVRSRVMEYGGQPWTGVPRDGGPFVVFVNHADQRLYGFELGGEPRPLTPVSPVGGGLRWVDPRPHPERDEVWCVLEEFTGEGPTDVRRVVAAVPLDGSAAEDRSAVRELTDDSRRFVTCPRLSPDGRRAAWLAWDHPGMPWDGTSLLVAEVTEDGRLGAPRSVAGGPEESVAQVDWAADGTLVYSSDTTGYWNLYRLNPDHAGPGRVEPGRLDPDGGGRTALCAREEEFGGPLWKVGWSWFALLDDGLVAVIHGRGATALGVLDLETGQVVDAAGPWTEFAPSLAVRGGRILGIGASPRSAYEVVELDAATGDARVIGAAHDDPVDPAYYPEPQIRSFLGPAGREIHAHVYPPHNPGAVAFSTELPPYVVWAHGGPTSRAPLVLDLAIAYFTSRGIGVAEVNYGGSTGYGREYRNRLREQWGVVDVEDCAAVALALADEGTADRTRLAIRGGSAGGWTAAVSLTSTDVYACGTILYPVLDLAHWGPGETHDFESRYLESLIGPPAEEPMRYAERSPTEHADRITAPFLLLQGLDDVICPPAQSERFLARLDGRVPHAYLAFEGEGHGFRRAETMVRVLEAELSLYARVFGLNPPGIPTLELAK
ncbi:LpqB family beta-propeller domain-containing protein [Streptomyces caniscabiei]|uniref:dipeptidyl-peptidase 5 n=1 Tax=Streptomyces caniscabiei TaxID=2746961 RepID=UPI0029A9556F|nr:LpqB family beta-propeller domain-containing protein [Streptomyces caniscabiei]MDX2603665.1 LpqB family beta-propeller domain-containing protein [Streptomyces caniscabiei]MDX2738803.1 LpqB family beta-propeller domain-containing protein [Streptomyces caniscabiei]MDX2777332.1 LpqB family beta-propeller domain-containing protein [Streptomyces caniscabiei]